MKNRLFKVFLGIVLAGTTAFLVSPLAMMIVQGIRYIIPCISSEEILFAIGLSIKTATISTAICLVLSILSGYAIYRCSPRRKTLIENIIYTPMSLPHLVSGIALLLMFGRNGIGDLLNSNFNLDFIFTPEGIVLAQVFINLPFAIKMIQTSLDGVDTKTLFTSRTLGCSELQSFFYILLPSMKQGIFSSVIMTWSKALGEFGAVMMVAGTTRMKTEVIPTAIYLNMATGDMNMAVGTATILIVISLSCIMAFNLITSRERRR